MLKRIVQVFFIVIGGMLGYLYIPDLIRILNIGDLPNNVTSPYVGAVIGALILFLSTFWLSDYVVGLIRWARKQW